MSEQHHFNSRMFKKFAQNVKNEYFLRLALRGENLCGNIMSRPFYNMSSFSFKHYPRCNRPGFGFFVLGGLGLYFFISNRKLKKQLKIQKAATEEQTKKIDQTSFKQPQQTVATPQIPSHQQQQSDLIISNNQQLQRQINQMQIDFSTQINELKLLINKTLQKQKSQ